MFPSTHPERDPILRLAVLSGLHLGKTYRQMAADTGKSIRVIFLVVHSLEADGMVVISGSNRRPIKTLTEDGRRLLSAFTGKEH